MNIQVEEKSSCEKKVYIEVLLEEYKHKLDREYEEYRKNVKLEGFRKGKVPLSLVKRVYGKEIEIIIIDRLVQEYYVKALESEDIHPLARGTVEDIDFEQEKHLKFNAIVEVEPSFEIGDISGIKVTKEVRKIKDENINQELERIRFSMAVKQNVEGPAEINHYILADIQQIDSSTNVPIVGRKWEERYFKLGDNSLLGDNMDQQLVGVCTGEIRTVERRYPEDHQDKTLGGKTERFLVEVKNVEDLELPPLDDELAKDIDEKLKTLDDLKDRIKRAMESQAEREARENMFRELENQMIAQYDFDLPSNMVEDYLNKLIEGMKKNSKEPVDEAYMKDVFRTEAVRNLRWHFISEKLIARNNITTEDEEVNARIDELAEVQDMGKEKAMVILKSKKNQDRLREQIINEKVQQVLEQAAEITVKEV